MKIAFSNIGWPTKQDDEIGNLLRNYGITSIEIAPSRYWTDPLNATKGEIESIRSNWQKRGFQIIAIQSLLFGHPELELFGSLSSRMGLLNRLKGVITVGKLLDAKFLVFGSPKNRLKRDFSFDEACSIAIPFFREIALCAEEHGVVFCIEPNAKHYGCDFVTNSEEAYSLVKRVDSNGFGLHLDLGNMRLAGEDPHMQITKYYKSIRHFHLSSPDLKQVTAGDLHGVRQALAGIDRQFTISIEMLNSTQKSIQSTLEVLKAASLLIDI